MDMLRRLINNCGILLDNVMATKLSTVKVPKYVPMAGMSDARAKLKTKITTTKPKPVLRTKMSKVNQPKTKTKLGTTASPRLSTELGRVRSVRMESILFLKPNVRCSILTVILSHVS